MNDSTKKFVKVSVILLIVITIIYVIGYKKWEKQEFDDRIDYSEYIEKPQLQEEKIITEKDAKILYEKINYKFVEENYGNDFFDIYYKNKEFSSEFIIYLAIINIQKDSFRIDCNKTIEIDKKIVDNKIKEIFGSKIKYNDTDIITLNNSLKIEYVENLKKYIITNSKCSGNNFGTGYIETEFLSYQETNGILQIIEYAYYIDYKKDEDGQYIINYYDSLDNTGNIIAKNKITEKDKLLKYKLVFEKDTEGIYAFKKIEKLKWYRNISFFYKKRSIKFPIL